MTPAISRHGCISVLFAVTLSAQSADIPRKTEDSKPKAETRVLPVDITSPLTLRTTLESIAVDAKLDGHGAVIVVVDLTKLSPLQRVYDLVIPVEFLDGKGTVVAREQYQFTDATIPTLVGGKKYKRPFEHSVKAVALGNGKLRTLPAQGIVGSSMEVGMRMEELLRLLEKINKGIA